MPSIRDSAPFEFPAHLRSWTAASSMSHFEFHHQRAKVAPRRLKLVEIQRLVNCEEHFPDGDSR
jgi:hypothetical protein